MIVVVRYVLNVPLCARQCVTIWENISGSEVTCPRFTRDVSCSNLQRRALIGSSSGSSSFGEGVHSGAPNRLIIPRVELQLVGGARRRETCLQGETECRDTGSLWGCLLCSPCVVPGDITLCGLLFCVGLGFLRARGVLSWWGGRDLLQGRAPGRVGESVPASGKLNMKRVNHRGVFVKHVAVGVHSCLDACEIYCRSRASGDRTAEHPGHLGVCIVMCFPFASPFKRCQTILFDG